MTSEELFHLKELFAKRTILEAKLDKLQFPLDAKFTLKSFKVEIDYYVSGRGWHSKVLDTCPVDSNELRHFFTKERNKIMLELYELNHQIKKIKIIP